MGQITLGDIYTKLNEIESKIINIEVKIEGDNILSEDDIEAIENAEEEYKEGKMISLEGLEAKRKNAKN